MGKTSDDITCIVCCQVTGKPWQAEVPKLFVSSVDVCASSGDVPLF